MSFSGSWQPEARVASSIPQNTPPGYRDMELPTVVADPMISGLQVRRRDSRDSPALLRGLGLQCIIAGLGEMPQRDRNRPASSHRALDSKRARRLVFVRAIPGASAREGPSGVLAVFLAVVSCTPFLHIGFSEFLT